MRIQLTLTDISFLASGSSWIVAHLTPEIPFLSNVLSLVSGCLSYYSAFSEWNTGRSNGSNIDLEAGLNEPLNIVQTSWVTWINLAITHFQFCIKFCILVREIVGLSQIASVGLWTDNAISFVQFIINFKTYFPFFKKGSSKLYILGLM